MKKEIDLRVVQHTCEDLVRLITSLPRDKGNQWIAYLFEALEEESGSEEILTDAQDILKERLDLGRW